MGSSYAPEVKLTLSNLATDEKPTAADPLIDEAEKTLAHRTCGAYVRDEHRRTLDRCSLPVFGEFDWPGAAKASRQCLIHTIKAIHVAAVLGFTLSVRRCKLAEAAEDTPACGSRE